MSIRGRKPKEPLTISVGGIAVQSKQCTKCRGIKPLDNFDRLWRASDGRQPTCKSCKRELNAKRNRAGGW